MLETTVVVKTIGRPTLENAIRSAKREGFKPLIVSDGVEIPKKRSLGCKRIILGRRWGFYGGMVANVAAAMISTPYITFLDDDDEFVKGAGDIIRSKINERPEVDIWIAGIEYDYEVQITRGPEVLISSNKLSMYPELGITTGNAAMPTYKTEIFSKIPFRQVVPDHLTNLTDMFHVKECSDKGCNVDWFQEVLYKVRPKLFGPNGEGKR